MPGFYRLIGLIFFLTNFGYVLASLEDPEGGFVSPVLLVVSGLISFLFLWWIRKRLIEMDRREGGFR
jgi:hypothetical protein